MEVCWAEKKILFYFSDVISRKKKYFSDESCKHEKKNEKSWATIAQLFVIEKTKFSN